MLRIAHALALHPCWKKVWALALPQYAKDENELRNALYKRALGWKPPDSKEAVYLMEMVHRTLIKCVQAGLKRDPYNHKHQNLYNVLEFLSTREKEYSAELRSHVFSDRILRFVYKPRHEFEQQAEQMKWLYNISAVYSIDCPHMDDFLDVLYAHEWVLDLGMDEKTPGLPEQHAQTLREMSDPIALVRDWYGDLPKDEAESKVKKLFQAGWLWQGRQDNEERFKVVSAEFVVSTPRTHLIRLMLMSLTLTVGQRWILIQLCLHETVEVDMVVLLRDLIVEATTAEERAEINAHKSEIFDSLQKIRRWYDVHMPRDFFALSKCAHEIESLFFEKSR